MTFDTSSRARTSTGTETITSYATATRRVGPAARVLLVGSRAWRACVGAVRRAAAAIGRTVMPGGWVALAAVASGLVLGLPLGWAEALAAGVVAAALLALAAVFLFGGNAYDVRMGLLEERVVAGEDITGDIDVRNVSRRVALPGLVEIPIGPSVAEVHVPLLRGGAEHHQQVLIPAQRRGIVQVGPVTSVRGDPLGLLRREIVWTKRRELFVHPRTTTLPTSSAGFVRDLEGTPSRLLVSDDISFHAIREYTPGDDPRTIHWKSTAKTGALMVRQFEQTRRSKLAVVLGLAAAEYAEDEEFELAVSAAASIGVRLIRDARDVDVMVSAEIPEAVRRVVRSVRRLSVASPRTLLDECSGVDRSEAMMGFEEVCELTAAASDGLSLMFLVCGSTPSLRELRHAALRFPPDTAVVVVRAQIGAEPGVRRFGDLTICTIGELVDVRALFARMVQS